MLTGPVQVDRETLDMLKAINMAGLPGVVQQQVSSSCLWHWLGTPYKHTGGGAAAPVWCVTHASCIMLCTPASYDTYIMPASCYTL
jgi:hypothetical protein